MDHTLFVRLAQLGERLEQTSKRNEMAEMLADFLQRLLPAEIPASVRLVIGQVFPEWDDRALSVSWKTMMAVIDSLTDAPEPIRDQIYAQAVDGGESVRQLLEQTRRDPPIPPPLTVLDVFHTLESIAETAGQGSRARKEALLSSLFERATPIEAKYLSKIIYQEMRHGASEGLMLNGIAKAAGIKSKHVRRANQLWGDLGKVAFVALTEGEAPLRAAELQLFRPLKPMLAQSAENLDEGFERFQGRVALEYKLDGARVQIHRLDDKVRIYSRNLANVTSSLPDVVAEVRNGQAASGFVFEGEAVAIDLDGRPLPFQHLMRRFRRKHAIAELIEEIPVQLHLFDALYVNGKSLLDNPYHERWSALQSAAGSLPLVPRLTPQSAEEGQAFVEAAYRDGHEGVMIKDLASTYSPGVRGQSWLKLKHTMSLDLVIVAADWGYGRRHGWLSNYHLAAINQETGKYVVVGKTFKGLTDAEFQVTTERLLALERSRQRGTIFVKPKIVVEVLFNEIQESSQYLSRLTLRFARITRFRDDKTPNQADSLQTLRNLYEKQFQYKGRLTR